VSLCQISPKSVKTRPRYGDFSIFQNGGRRHLGFLKLQISNCGTCRECRIASPCQNIVASVKPFSRNSDFGIFQDGFLKILILTVETVKNVELRHYVKFCRKRWSRGRDTPSFWICKISNF